MKKIWLVTIIIAVILVIVLGVYISYLHGRGRVDNQCGSALTEYNIQILYGGNFIEGQYYWVDTHDNWANVQKIDGSKITFIILNDSTELKDSSLKIVKLDRNTDLTAGGPSDTFNINYDLNNDPRYARGKSEINQTRIMEAVRQYSISNPEYYEIKNFFTNEPFTMKNVTIDLKTGKVVSSNSVEDKSLWMPCEY
jgi:hypothetical protein